MAKQPPFQDKRFPHHLPYTPGPPPKDYENEQSGLPSSFPTTSSRSSQHVQHPHYPIAVAGPSQWAHSSMPGQPENSSVHPGAISSHQSTQAQGAVIALPPSPTSSFKSNASRRDTNPPEAGAILEEKRQRNTAASARFRARKKERNQHLEQTLTGLSSRAEELEREASDLRRENTWLKEIVIMKGRQNLNVMSASSETSTRRGGATSSSTASTSKQKTPENLNVSDGADDNSYDGSDSE